MSFPYTATLSKLGKIGAMIGQVDALTGSAIPGQVAALEALYSGAADLSSIDGIYSSLSSFQSSPSGFLAALRGFASATLSADVAANAPTAGTSTAQVIAALIASMQANGQSVAAATVSASVSANPGNSGNAALAVGLKSRYGYQLDNVFAETVTGIVAGDAQSGTATKNQEPIRFQGQPAASNRLGPAWPAGSGSSLSLSCVDAGASATTGQGQWLTNGNFESWVGNTPTGWTIGVGTAGTQVVKQTASFYDGAAACGFVGDGSTLTAIQQPLASVQPATQYAFNLWAAVSSVPGAGVLEVALVDASGTVLQDTAGNNASATFSLSALTTSFAPLNGYLRTPRVLPPATYLRVRLSTALSSGATLVFDRMSFTQPAAFYAQGPYLAAFSGSSPMIVSDGWSIVVANSGPAWQQLMNRLFSMNTLGLLLPTSGSPTISSSLIA